MTASPPSLAKHATHVERVQRISQVGLILDVCCRVTGMGFSAVARVTDETWLTCAALDNVGFGLKPGDELPLQTTICDEIRQHKQVVVFDDAALDDKYKDHHTPRIYGLRSYISVPIIQTDGTLFGTLCAIDTNPRKINTPETIGMFKLFAELIASQLSAQSASEETARALIAERETARLREEFIAVVGHDLRNPVAAVSAGLRLLERNVPQSDVVRREMRKSIARMSSIISNLMDLARGRLGGGIAAAKQPGVILDDLINDVVTEIRAFSDQDIIVRSKVDAPIFCDPQRIGQLLSNLIGNAVTHGTEGFPVTLDANISQEVLTITVINQGRPIPDAVLEGLFQPFRRAEAHSSSGLGLGLYISSEIARGHGGTLTARCNGGEIAFTFAMPLGDEGHIQV
ncbi:GAF domain-containing sensor histidine kinase [Cypionkella sp.]|uniref:GAF domain-containing sensor histidine kinase n=1 Tax=Cypionkella sp. TaxID=2811411 RepID=UPI002620B2D3|nr:GAF domain-containing sensor histidine kinase [Cypionkella sp.]MDB5665160.1 sensor signal transduction histidine kinase [Cypionkella sp.]